MTELLTPAIRKTLPAFDVPNFGTDPKIIACFVKGNSVWYAVAGSPVDEDGDVIEAGKHTEEADFQFYGYKYKQKGTSFTFTRSLFCLSDLVRAGAVRLLDWTSRPVSAVRPVVAREVA